MDIVEFFRDKSFTFIPRTPFAAIKAFEAGILPIEYFIYKSTSSISLDEEIIDMLEIERVISKPDLDIHANRLLIIILEKLIGNTDYEIALFAAESINLIESRYTVKIEKLKDELVISNDLEKKIQLARLFYEFALLNYNKQSIRIFYFKEAYSKMRDMIDFITNLDDVNILIRILIELKQYENAIDILNYLNKDNNLVLLSFLAEVEFERKNYTRVYNILSYIFSRKSELNVKIGNICSYWLDSSWIERSEFV